MLLVLAYHRVADGELDPLGLCVSPAHFADQLTALATNYEVVSLRDGVASPGARSVQRIAITFDDGYLDNLTRAAPLLAKAGLPATYFVTLNALEGAPFWWDQVTAAHFQGEGRRVVARIIERAVNRDSRSDRILLKALRRLAPHTVSFDTTIELLRRLRGDERARICARLPRLATPPTITTQGLRELAASPLTEIGAHGVDHTSFGALTVDEMDEQLATCSSVLEQVTGHRPWCVAWPYGGADDLPDGELASGPLNKHGYQCALTTLPQVFHPGDSPMRVGRFVVRDGSGGQLVARLRAAFAA